MTQGDHPPFRHPLVRWIDARLPVFSFLAREYGTYPVPRNLGYLWSFGGLAMFLLATMIVSGVVLAMQYTPDTGLAFDSVQRIVRDVDYGWLLRSIHATGASMFFFVLYVHMGRGLYYGSYKRPRELLWIFGVILFALMMATAFMGYVLPWSQTGLWGATVITNLVTAIPWVGNGLAHWVWGGDAVGNPTLHRFYALHYLVPFVICAMAGLHIWALHVSGSNNPLGIDVKSAGDTLPFHPYYTIKDLFALGICLLVYAVFIFYCPDYLGHPDDFVPADPLVTPAHIVPEWYFLPFFAILRSVPDKLAGAIALGGAVLILLAVPWLDRSPVRSARFRPVYRRMFWLLVADMIGLGYAGAHAPQGMWLTFGRLGSLYYFAYFIVLLPLAARLEKPLPLPDSIAAPVPGRAPDRVLDA